MMSTGLVDRRSLWPGGQTGFSLADCAATGTENGIGRVREPVSNPSRGWRSSMP